jgi:predicted TIM-barrel fold metal-dependent hydrolase
MGMKIIDAVVNLWTEEALSYRPDWGPSFFVDKMKVDRSLMAGLTLEAMVDRMESAGIQHALLVAPKAGRNGLKGCYHLPPEVVARAVEQHPGRFSGLIGIDPYMGMQGVRELASAVQDHGFVGAHVYPHWFELPPDHARYYPFYAKCCELGVPIQIQVGQSMIYTKEYPCRSVGHPMTLDAIACDFPELTIIGIHVGIPWTDEMIAMSWKHENVYIGCDAHSPKYWPGNFVRYIDSYGQDKVVFGTDFPVLDFRRAVDEVRDLGLKDEVLAKLFWRNAQGLYCLG